MIEVLIKELDSDKENNDRECRVEVKGAGDVVAAEFYTLLKIMYQSMPRFMFLFIFKDFLKDVLAGEFDEGDDE